MYIVAAFAYMHMLSICMYSDSVVTQADVNNNCTLINYYTINTFNCQCICSNNEWLLDDGLYNHQSVLIVNWSKQHQWSC